MNKKVIERILKNLLENETYTLDKEETRILLQYIADLQRKEYNNKKAIEYILQNCEIIRINDAYGNFTDKVGIVKGMPVLNILEGNNE